MSRKTSQYSHKFTNDMHKMKLKMQNMDFSYLEKDKINVQIENESLKSMIAFLKGE